jgi:hypothetical protein
LTHAIQIEKYKSEITGNLDIFVLQNEEEHDGETTKRQDILIHGDPEDLKSLAKLLIERSDANQDDITDLLMGQENMCTFGQILT